MYSSHERTRLHVGPARRRTSSSSGMLMLNMDPPLHTRYRRLINKGFTPRMVSASSSRRCASGPREIIDRIADRGECDFVVDVASELPLQVIADLMGVPQEDRHKMFDWSNRMIGAEDPEYGITEEMAAERVDGALRVRGAAGRAEAGRPAGRPDLDPDARPRSTASGSPGLEIDLFFLLLSVAGNETTAQPHLARAGRAASRTPTSSSGCARTRAWCPAQSRRCCAARAR